MCVCVCVCACLYVCMYACIFARIYAFMYVCSSLRASQSYTCVCVSVCVCLYVCMHVYLYVCMYVCTHICMHECKYACMHAWTYGIYLRTYVYTYTHISCIHVMHILIHWVHVASVDLTVHSQANLWETGWFLYMLHTYKTNVTPVNASPFLFCSLHQKRHLFSFQFLHKQSACEYREQEEHLKHAESRCEMYFL